MKKVLSVLLATLMFLTLLMPLSVFAANGPYPVDWDNMTEEKLEELESMSYIAVMDLEMKNMGYVYPKAIADILPVNSKAISYNSKNNTLTLNNFKTDLMLVLCAMGDDLKIKLAGYNELGCIVSSDLNWGGSVTVTGSGVLVVNKNKTYPESVVLDVEGTGYGFFKTEKTTAVRFFGTSNGDEIHPSIGVYGTKEADASKVIMLNGTTKAEKTETYPMYVYEQEKVLLAEKFETEGYGEFLVSTEEGKENNLYFGKHAEETGSYDVYEVVLDSELNNYVLVQVDGLVNVSPSQCKMKELADTSKVPEVIVSVSSKTVSMNKCLDADGNEAVFVDNSEYIVPLEDVEVYKVVNHSKYGKVALVVNPSKEYKKLNIIESKTTYVHVNYTQTLTVNKIVTKVPGKVTLKKVENAYGGVKVTWKAVSGADSYKVYRKASNEKKWTAIGTSKSTEYVDKTAKNGVKYSYTVKAKNIVGYGSYDTKGLSTTYIAAPTTKIANTASGIKVSWNKISGATNYRVYRSVYSNGKWSSWETMVTTNAKTSSWTDKKVKSGKTYRYTVRTLKNKLASGNKATGGLCFLSVPTVKIANASEGVKVSWNKISGAKNYIVYRSEYTAKTKSWSKLKKIGTVGAVTSYVDKTAKSGVQYKYTVKAVNGKSNSTYKLSAQLLYLAAPTTKISNASNGIKVSWSKSAGAKSYTVYRSQYDTKNKKWSSWSSVATAKSDKTSWTDKSVKSGTQYKYTVRAVNGKVKSSYKATSGLVFISAPTLKATNASYSVKVSWSKVTGATQYKLYRSELKDGKWSSWSTLTTLEANTTSFVDKTVAVGSVYKYTLKAINGSSLSAAAPSDEIWYSYAPAISIVNGETGIVVNWEHINGAEKYIFYRSEEKNGKWTEWKMVKTVNSTTEYWVDETVVPDGKYKYAVKAQKGDDKTVSKVSNELVYIKTRYVF